MKGIKRRDLLQLGWIFPVFFLLLPDLARGQAPPPPHQTCKSQTPLIMAIRRHDFNEIRRLIDSRVDLNAKSCEEGITALSEAIAERLPEVAKQLIAAGADPNDAGTDGTSALMAAAYYCDDTTASLLLKGGAQANATDNAGYSALMMATQHCADGVVIARLLRAGADVNLRTKTGRTALIVAAFYGNELAVLQLVAAGADLSAQTRDGTALTIARDRKIGRQPSHDRIFAFLSAFAN